jgi:spore germination cell wall hydrolase CwlJ-like protein
MRALRWRSTPLSRAAVLVPGAAATFLMMSTQSIAYQDLTSYLAQRSGADQTWRRHVASLVRPSTVVAGFAFARPIQRDEARPGAILASAAADMAYGDLRRAGRMPGPPLGAGMDRDLIYPVVNREAKGDLLIDRPQLRLSIGSLDQDLSLLAAPADIALASRFQRDPDGEPTDTEHSPLALGGFQLAAVAPTAIMDDRPAGARLGLVVPVLPEPGSVQAEEEASRGRQAEAVNSGETVGITITGEGLIARAGAGFGAPSIPLESAPFRVTTTHEPVPGFDPVLGPFAIDRRGDRPDSALARALQAPRSLSLDAPAQDNAPPRVASSTAHPAVSLALTGPAHARAERCLAEAVYWEARSEPERGQMAVAQVVLNRAVSGFYPRDVCGVVYQNAHRYLACQFTFACEGKALRIRDTESWERAKSVASAVIEGKTYHADVGGATHYHADYVRPYWARRLKKMDVIGRHIFYKLKPGQT